MTPEQEGLILDNQCLPNQIARLLLRKGIPPNHYDEMADVGRLALVEAASRYNKSKGASFRTFASYRVRGAMVDYIRDIYKSDFGVGRNGPDKHPRISKRAKRYPERPNGGTVINCQSFRRSLIANGSPVLW
jgi:DNA-directed RNA polymerase specialized sigma subunit